MTVLLGTVSFMRLCKLHNVRVVHRTCNHGRRWGSMLFLLVEVGLLCWLPSISQTSPTSSDLNLHQYVLSYFPWLSTITTKWKILRTRVVVSMEGVGPDFPASKMACEIELTYIIAHSASRSTLVTIP